MEVNAEEIGRQLEMIKTAGDSLEALVKAVESTRQSSEKLLDLSTFLEESGEGLTSLVVSMGQDILANAAGSQEVAAAAQEQTASQEEVASAAASMRAVTEQLHKATQKFSV